MILTIYIINIYFIVEGSRADDSDDLRMQDIEEHTGISATLPQPLSKYS